MHLDLSWCSQVTDKGILSLSQFQPQILSLSLSTLQSIQTAVPRLAIREWSGFAHR
jgi:hypothetical protein